MRALARFLVVQGAAWTFIVSVPWVFLVVYPGVLRWTAPVLCPSDQPTARVVEYSVTTSDGNGTNFTLVCVGPEGDITEAGSWAPLGVYLLGFVVVVQAIVLPLQLLGFLIGRRARGPSPW